MSMELKKHCHICKIEKPLTAFLASRKTGKPVSYCHPCYHAYRKARRTPKPIPDYPAIEGESWRPIPDYEGLYSVSDKGRVRREVDGKGLSRKGRMIKMYTVRGYFRVPLYRNQRQTHHLLHRLIAAAFIGPCPDGYVVNHKNGIKTDNDPSNLEYMTPRENVLHSYDVLGNRERQRVNAQRRWDSGDRKFVDHPPFAGENHPNAKLTMEQVRQIRAEYVAHKPSQQKLANRFNVSRAQIGRIVNNQLWADES